MAKIPTLKKLLREDFPTDLPWLSKLIQSLNGFIETTTNALDGDLVIGQNIAGQINQVSIYANQNVPVSFQWKSTRAPAVLMIGKISIKDAPQGTSTGYVIGQPEWYFDSQKSLIVITKLPGLTLPDASKTYILNILVFPGST